MNVGGGIRIAEVGIELPLAVALYSARINQPVPALTAVVGEVSLAGEVRSVPHMDKRMRAVREMSFSRLVHPAASEVKGAPEGLCLPAASLAEAVRLCFAGSP